MRVRIDRHRVTMRIGVCLLGSVEFVDGVADITEERFDAVATAVATLGYTLKRVPTRSR